MINQEDYNKAILIILTELTALVRGLGYEYSDDLSDSTNDAAIVAKRLSNIIVTLDNLKKVPELDKANLISLGDPKVLDNGTGLLSLAV